MDNYYEKGLAMSTVTITLKAFGNAGEARITSVSFPMEVEPENHLAFCEKVFADTNCYSGWVWDIIEPLLSPNRTHTALSVGDEIKIGEKSYLCDRIGFVEIKDENATVS